MNRIKRSVVTLVAALCLLFSLLPAARAEAVVQTPVDAHVPDGVVQSAAADQKTPSSGEELIEQIRTTYKKAKKSAHRKNFKGKCGAYVNRQLVVLGINKKYIGCNGNREFDVYSKKTETTGGYRIIAYSRKNYTLKEALEAIAKSDPHARNILVGFEKGFSKAGKRYGHTLFIHGIENGMVYFSDNFTRKINGKRYKEGDPIVCSIDTFVKLYKKCKFDGIIHFT
ncbi:MAG: hypothetical protein IJJ86_07020 [Clostridia bacterium]|nr:hypothetical protein [Clostridia bacterium]